MIRKIPLQLHIAIAHRRRVKEKIRSYSEGLHQILICLFAAILPKGQPLPKVPVSIDVPLFRLEYFHYITLNCGNHR
jgi:hypothetical protein